LIVELLDLDSAFVIYSTPIDEFGDFWFLSGSALDLEPIDLNSPGFVFHPFDKKDPGFMLEGTPHPMELFPASSEITEFEHEQPDSEYLDSIEKIIEQIKAGECEKVVLSRVKRIHIEKIRVKEVLARLKFDNPNALIYLVHHPKVGTWFGATPETLLKRDKGQLSTMSLAATKHKSDKTAWNKKEQEEQQIVTDFILKRLEKAGASNVNSTGPNTILAGQLGHLCTDINFESNDIQTVVDQLHPTPAICGLPYEKARNMISDLEIESRAYYCGYLGPISNKGDLHLFVNLRCAQVLDDHLRMHVGGGITANSNPEEEWNETELKAQTLLRVL